MICEVGGTLLDDCGEPVRCPDCDLPYMFYDVLVARDGKPFACHYVDTEAGVALLLERSLGVSYRRGVRGNFAVTATCASCSTGARRDD